MRETSQRMASPSLVKRNTSTDPAVEEFDSSIVSAKVDPLQMAFKKEEVKTLDPATL